MTLKRIIGFLQILMGLGFFLLAIATFLFIPEALDQYAQEPEDLLGLMAISAFCLMSGGACILTAITLFRGTPAWLSRRSIIVLNGTVAVFLVLFTSLGLVRPEPALTETRFLWIPALIAIISLVLLVRHESAPSGSSAPSREH